MQDIGEFVLRSLSVICPQCDCGFATPCLTDLPPVTEEDSVEADLHRVLPESLRAALITVCPHCSYAGWTVKFSRTRIRPEILPDARPIDHSKKFALAVKEARKGNINPLDIAFIAVNGLYCAREAGQPHELWLELAAYEQNRGMTEEFLVPDNGFDRLLMAELWRQLKSFDKALAEYDKAARDEFIPEELIKHQKMIAQQGDWMPMLLPPYLVRLAFPADPVVVSPGEMGKNGRPIPSTAKIHLEPKSAEAYNGPPDRRQPLSSVIKNNVIPLVADAQVAAVAPQLHAMPVVADAPLAAVMLPSHVMPVAADAPVAPAMAPPDLATVQPAASMALIDQPTIPPVLVAPVVVTPHVARSVYVVQASPSRTYQDVAASPGGAGVLPDSSGTITAGAGETSGPAMLAPPGVLQHTASHISPDLPNEINQRQYPGNTISSAVTPQSMDREVGMRLVSNQQEDKDKFPAIELLDASWGLVAARGEATQPKKKAAAPQAQSAGQNDPQSQSQDDQSGGSINNDYTDAIARVESFLNLTRQPSYQNWLRGYKTS